MMRSSPALSKKKVLAWKIETILEEKKNSSVGQ